MLKGVALFLFLFSLCASSSGADIECGTDVPKKLPYTSAVLEPPPPGSPTSVISLLVAYTPQTVTDLTSFGDNIGSYINWEVGRLNQALTNSGVNAQFVLAGSPLALTQNSPFDITLPNPQTAAFDLARENGDGVWDEIFTARNARGADLILVLYEGSGGKASIPKIPGPATARDCVAVVGLNVTRYADGIGFSHELGHLMGLAHDLSGGGNTTTGVHPFSMGYKFTGVDSILYRTIMAYAPGALYLGFSNPSINYQGSPTGVDNVFNESYTIRSTAPLIAAYSDTPICDPLRTVEIFLQKDSANSTIYIYMTDRYGDGSIVPKTVYNRWEFIGGSWVREGSGYSESTTGYAGAITPGSIKQIRITPDIYVTSNTLTGPNLSNATITISSLGTTITGQILIGGSPVDIRGNWMDIKSYSSTHGGMIKLTSVPVNSAGVFTYTATQNGIYQAAIGTHSVFSNQLTISSIVTPTPTASATATPTATPTKTSTPTNTPTPLPTAVVTPLPTLSPTPTMLPPTIAPSASPTSNPAIYEIALSVKKLSKTIVHLGGLLKINSSPISNAPVTLRCNGQVVATPMTSSTGRFEKKLLRTSRAKSCRASYGSIGSNLIKIPKK